MNEELRSAHLLWDGPKTIDDEFEKTYAGHFGPITIVDADKTEDLLAIKRGIYTGGYCNFHETLVLYQRDPLRRLPSVNAEPTYTHG